MPKMMVPVDTETQAIAGSGTFQFSAARPETLGATEYTLATLVVDVSSSVSYYRNELEEMIKNVAEACRKTNRVDNLLLRLTTFNSNLDEVLGFVPLNKVDPNNFPNLQPSGMTALYDAVYEAVAATTQYAGTLTNQDFDVNAIMFIVTDGADNQSTVRPNDIAEAVRKAKKSEIMESFQSVLIGIDDVSVSGYLQNFKDEAELDDFISVGDATPEALAKLGQFISKSVSSTSQSLGSGGPSQLLTF